MTISFSECKSVCDMAKFYMSKKFKRGTYVAINPSIGVTPANIGSMYHGTGPQVLASCLKCKYSIITKELVVKKANQKYFMFMFVSEYLQKVFSLYFRSKVDFIQ